MSSEKIITMSSLGNNGRFGNQFFQYIFLKCYAKENNYSVEIPQYAGREIFEISDSFISEKLPRIYELSNDDNQSYLLNLNSKLFNCDLWGWFQFHTGYYQPNRNYIRTLFSPKGHFLVEGSLILNRLLQEGKTLVTIHLRRGDGNLRGAYYYAPTAWYLDWLKSIWSTLDEPVLYIASDDPQSVVPDFKDYSPYQLSDFINVAQDHSYYFDFFIMQNSSHLAISNSSFSFAASMLNEKCETFLRPCKKSGNLVQFDPWDSDPIKNNRYEPNSELSEQINNLLLHQEDDALKVNGFRDVRKKVIDIWLSTSEYELEPLFQSKFGVAYRGLLHSPRIMLHLDSTEQKTKLDLLETVNTGMHTVWFMQYLLSAMLLCDPGEFIFQHNLELFPEWFLPDYMRYLQKTFK